MSIPLQTVSEELLTAQLKLADLTYANLVKLQGGYPTVNWSTIRNGQRAVNAIQRQYILHDNTSNGFNIAWTCLVKFTGNYAPGIIDPNAQNPGIIIEIELETPMPVVIGWSDFSTDGSPDGGFTRITYYNTAWAGWDPFMALTSPGLTGLELGSDYTLIPSGGFTLLLTGNVPGLTEGQIITVYNYSYVGGGTPSGNNHFTYTFSFHLS